MPGDQRVGAMLRELRTSRNLTLAAVARQAGCAESLLSYVENGRRQLHPWLAEQLDAIYGTGGAITALAPRPAPGGDSSRAGRTHTAPRTGLSDTDMLEDMLVVRLPEGGVTMPVSRRELLAGLSIGVLGGALADRVEHVLNQLDLVAGAGGEPLAVFERAFAGFSTAARSLPPGRLIDGLIGQVALLEGLRRRAPATRRGAYAVMQARYAESLSWLCEEASDAAGALYWVGRAAQWAAAARWEPMVGYTFVRRSMLVINFTGEGCARSTPYSRCWTCRSCPGCVAWPARRWRWAMRWPASPTPVRGRWARQCGCSIGPAATTRHTSGSAAS